MGSKAMIGRAKARTNLVGKEAKANLRQPGSKISDIPDQREVALRAFERMRRRLQIPKVVK